MKIIKKYDINSLFVCIGLLSALFMPEVRAMRRLPEKQFEEKFYENAWEQDLANLSNNENWDDKGFLTPKWIERAVKHAIELIEEGEKTVTNLIDELDDKLCELYKEKNPRTDKKMIASTLSKFFSNTIDNFAIINIFEKALQAKIAPEPESQLINEQKRQQQQKLEEQKQKEEKQLKGKMVWDQYLADLSKEENWYNDTLIKQKLLSHEKNNDVNYKWLENESENNLENKMPTRQWMEKATEFAVKLINEGNATKENIISALHKALTNYYGRGSYEVSVFTVGFVIDGFSKLLDENQLLYKNRQQQPKEEEQRQQRLKELQQKTEQMQKQREQEKREEIGKYEVLEKVGKELEQANLQQKKHTLKRELKEKLEPLKPLLDRISEGWKKAPSEDWQNSIVRVANGLIKENNTPGKRSEIYDAINNAISGHSKTLWFPDRQAIAAAKNNIFKQIFSSTVPEFKAFAQYFKTVATSPVSEDNDRDKDWIYDRAESYYSLNSATLEKIAHDAAALIKYSMVPTSVIENMMSRDLVEARKGKHPQFRSLGQLGIMKAINDEVQLLKELRSQIMGRRVTSSVE